MRTEKVSNAAAPAARSDDGASHLTNALDKEHEREIREELLLQRQRDRFDFQTEERTELEREYNTVRDMMLEQMKIDDEVVKKYVALI